MLRFSGAQHFRQRLVLSTISGRAIRIDEIRTSDQSPGLRDYEASLLRLIEKITNGCVVEINETGVTIGSALGWGVAEGGGAEGCSLSPPAPAPRMPLNLRCCAARPSLRTLRRHLTALQAGHRHLWWRPGA